MSKLMDRIATLLKADAHGVVESLEDRALLLKQYVREAELALDRKRARVEALREEQKRYQEALVLLDEQSDALDRDIELALRAGKDDLARFSIRRLIPRRHEIAVLRAQLDRCNTDAETLGQQLATQQAQYDRLRMRARCELAQLHDPSLSPPWASEETVADEEVEIELMRRRQSQGGQL